MPVPPAQYAELHNNRYVGVTAETEAFTIRISTALIGA